MHPLRRTLPSMALAALVLAAVPASAQEGPAAFEKKCAMCHGKDGSGETPAGKALKARDLRLPEVQKQGDAELVAWVSAGRPGKMPAFKDTLTAKEIKAVVAHLRTLKKP